MTVKQSPIADLMEKIQKGASSLGGSKAKKSTSNDNKDLEVDLGDALLDEPEQSNAAQQKHNEANACVDDDIIDAEVIEGQATKKLTAGERFRALSFGKKALLVVLVVAGGLALKNQVDSPNYVKNTAKVESAQKDGTPSPGDGQSMSLADMADKQAGLELPQAELGKISSATTPTPSSTGSGTAIGFDTSDGLELGTPSTGDGTKNPQGTDRSPSFSLNEPFGDGVLKSEGQLAEEAQTQQQATPATQLQQMDEVPPGLATAQVSQSVDKASAAIVNNQIAEFKQTSASQPAGSVQPGFIEDQKANAAANPFEKSASDTSVEPIGFDTRFGGSTSPKLDSGKPVLGKVDSNADVAKLKADLEAKDRNITELEGKLNQAEKALAAKNKPATPLHSRPASKPARSLASTSKAPSHSKVAQVSPAKVLPRPKLCVAAVAEPARNCSTCVAHAFISNRGQETMVGQGDYIDGYRVSIQGDRLDLQNDKGEIAHKFWSSPDGCKSS